MKKQTITKTESLKVGDEIELFGKKWTKWKTEKGILLVHTPLDEDRRFNDDDGWDSSNDWKKSSLCKWLNEDYRSQLNIPKKIEITIPSREEFEENWELIKKWDCKNWLWTRTPLAGNAVNEWYVYAGSATYSVGTDYAFTTYGVSPALWLPFLISVEDFGEDKGGDEKKTGREEKNRSSLSSKAKELGSQPAFPCEYYQVTRSDPPYGGTKTLRYEPQHYSGLTKREYFAGQYAAAGDTPKIAVEAADALLEELVREAI